MALLVQRYLSNTASSVFYGIACLIRLAGFAALFATFEEDMREKKSSVRQVVPPEVRRESDAKVRQPRRSSAPACNPRKDPHRPSRTARDARFEPIRTYFDQSEGPSDLSGRFGRHLSAGPLPNRATTQSGSTSAEPRARAFSDLTDTPRPDETAARIRFRMPMLTSVGCDIIHVFIYLFGGVWL